MKKFIKVVICILLVVCIFNVNVYASRANYDLYIKYNGNVIHYRGSTDDGVKEEIDPVSGNKIDNLQVGFDSSITSFTLRPLATLELNDFNMYSNGGINIKLTHPGYESNSLTINSHINSFYDSESEEYFAPSVIYSAQTFSVEGAAGDYSLTINYDATEEFYSSVLIDDSDTYACINCEKFLFGDTHAYCQIYLNDKTSKDLINKLSNETQIPVPIYASLEEDEKGASRIDWAGLSISSYTAAIKANIGFNLYYSQLDFLHLYSNKPYVGIECNHFPYDNSGTTPVFDRVNLTMRDEEYKRYSAEEIAFLIKDDSSLDFKDSILDIDYDLTLSTFIQMGKIDQGETDRSLIIFNDVYADISGRFYTHQSDIKFINGTNMLMKRAFTPVLTTDSENSTVEVDGNSTVLFNSIGMQNLSWIDRNYSIENIKGFDNATGSYDGWAKLEYDLKNPYQYAWVAIQKDCNISVPEASISKTVKSFERMEQPEAPEAPEDQYFDGWYYYFSWGPDGRWGSNIKYDDDEYVRMDMELSPRFLYYPINSVALNEYEVDYAYFDYNLRFEYTNKYRYNRGQKYAYKNNQCLYYYSDGTYYNNTTKEEIRRPTIDIPKSCDTYVFTGEYTIDDYRYNFSPYMTVTVNDTALNRITEDKVLNENSSCQIDESYEGYYVNSDLDKIYIQLVETIPELQYVDRIDINHSEFDFENISFSYGTTEGFISLGTMALLTKGQEKKYLAQISEKGSQIIDINTEELVAKEDVKDIDTAIVLVGISPKEYGLTYSSNLEVYANQNKVNRGDDMSQLVGVDGVESIKNISKDLEFFMEDEEEFSLLYVQLYFSTIEEPKELEEVPMVYPSEDTPGVMPYYKDDEGNFYEDPEGNTPIENIDEWKNDEGLIKPLSKENNNYELTLPKDTNIEIPVKSNSYKFTSNAPRGEFVGIYVDGKLIDPSNYKISDEGTSITFKDSYMNKLSIGSHTIMIVSKEGYGESSFTIKQGKKPTPPPYNPGYIVPKTGIY